MAAPHIRAVWALVARVATPPVDTASGSVRLLTESRATPAVAVAAERAGSSKRFTACPQARAPLTPVFLTAAMKWASRGVSSLHGVWGEDLSVPLGAGPSGSGRRRVGVFSERGSWRNLLISFTDDGSSQHGQV